MNKLSKLKHPLKDNAKFQNFVLTPMPSNFLLSRYGLLAATKEFLKLIYAHN